MGKARKRRRLDKTPNVMNRADLRHYFDYSPKGIEVLEDGLKEIPFGEYLVEQRIVDRYQLFRALQMHYRHPEIRIGECAAALGYAQISEIETLYLRFLQLGTVTV